MYENKVSVRNVKKSLVDRMFYADVTVTDGITGEVKTYEVRTNNQGNGFWIGEKQVTGTSQFQVRSKAAWRAWLR